MHYYYLSLLRSPAHPTLMVTTSSSGTNDLWNWAQSLGSDGIVVEPDGTSGLGLNKLKWSSDGRRMLVTSVDRAHVLGLAEDVAQQKGDKDAQMMNHHHLISRGLLDPE